MATQIVMDHTGDTRHQGSGGGSSFLGLATPLGAWFALALKLSVNGVADPRFR
jgi:hypothetical protein